MEYRTLGRTGLRVSEISCGTYRSFDQADVTALMQANLEVGSNLFDSAPMYGPSEANIGRALGTGKLKAGSAGLLIATKVLQQDLSGAKKQIENSVRVIGGSFNGRWSASSGHSWF